MLFDPVSLKTKSGRARRAVVVNAVTVREDAALKVSHYGQARRFHDVDHRLVRGLGVGVDDDHRVFLSRRMPFSARR